MENTSLSQRIVGAIVIISLAIIFIPILLETDQLDPGGLSISPIPEVPREISTIVFQLNEKNGKFEGEGLSGENLNEESLSVESLTASDRLNEKVTKAIENSANEVEVVEGGTTGIEVKAANAQAPSPVVDDGKQHSWMLQLASFKNEKNALKLRDTLRSKQYVAHVDERKLSSGSIWRVHVGPVLSHAKMVAIQTTLLREMKLKGLIRRRR